MSGPGVVPTLPSGSLFTQYYTQIDALTDAQGDPTNVITPDEGTVTVSGITDAGPATGSTIQAYLFGYTVVAGLPQETSIVAKTAMVSATDLHETDSQGNELYSWSATLPTAGLAPGLYALQSFAYVPGYVETNGVPVALSAYEDDQGTVTVDEAVPYTYVVRADTEIVSVGTAQSTVPVYLSNVNSTVQLSADGRYVVWTSGDEYEEDLQTGATIDLTTTGASAPTLAVTHSPTSTPVDHPDPYGPEDNGAYTARNYPTFTEGGVTFGASPDFDFNANDGTENPLPTVTDANGDTEVLAPFGVSKTMAGYAAAASDNGNAVLTVETSNVSYFTPYSSNGLTEDPQYYVVYRNPAPTLTLDPVNGTNEISPGASTVTLTGTSNAIGQSVEIDFGQAGAAVGTATVQADGSWSYSFDASTITGSSLFIEASVMSAAGTPASTSETAQISTLPAPTVTDIFGNESGEEGPTLGPGATLTIYLNTSAAVFVTGTPTLTLSNGEAATYSGGSGSQQIAFTYIPAIIDAGSSDLGVTGLNLPSGAAIADAAGVSLAGPFTQSLDLALQTVPVIDGLEPASASSAFTSNTATPGILVSAQSGETITLYDNGTAIGTGSTPAAGAELEVDEIEITPTVPLPEGQSTLTASATDGSGRSSALSAGTPITVDTVPPAETITGLAVNGNDDVTLAAQAGLAITVTGTLSAALQPGESVAILLPNGVTETVTPAAGATSFTFTPSATEAASFGAGGSISASVTDEAGNTGTGTTQSFTADSLRLITPVSADPTDPSQATGATPALSADGTTVAFEAEPTGDFGDAVRADATGAITTGIYVETLASGAVTLAQADGENPALSGDGTTLTYDEEGASGQAVYADDLTTGSVTLVSAAGGVAADESSFDPSISSAGTEIAFLSYADNLVAGVSSSDDKPQLYVATLSAGAVAGITAVSVAPDGTSGNGTTFDAALSGDGTEVAFSSTATNLLAANDPHTPNLSATTGQIYVRALAGNAASGLAAGQVVLVSGNADGTVGNATSDAATLSADGRYVVFTSRATNLGPGNLASGATLPAEVEQVYVKDLLTGTVSLVSQTAAGVVGDGDAAGASISNDGSTVVFSDSADNLAAGAAGEQLYAASLSDGVVTGLTLLSEAGAIPGDGASNAASLSADGKTVVFQSDADNLAAGAGASEAVYETETAPTVAICYLRGTRVATPAGAVPIETLGRGDRLFTRFGGVQAIKWIGRQSFAARFIARNPAQWPVRIAAGALGPALPVRDLFVSPGHSMLIADRLILARNLINGVTITQSQPTEDVHYYQVELEAQDCILAEAAWSETYADDVGLRNQFHNVGEFRILFPDHVSPAEPALCAPRPESGPALEAALRPIVDRATRGLTPGPLRGWIDIIEDGRISGWAQDMAYPEMPVLLDIWLQEKWLGTVLACDFRGDLAAAGIGRGYASFSFASPVAIPAGSAGRLAVCRAADGVALPMTMELEAKIETPKTPDLTSPAGSSRGPTPCGARTGFGRHDG
jgi:hypothetical protein